MYLNGEYFAKNPTWDAADAVSKVQWIKILLYRNRFDVDKVVDPGCGSGALLQQLSTLYPAIHHWEGNDISPQPIDMAKQTGDTCIFFIM